MASGKFIDLLDNDSFLFIFKMNCKWDFQFNDTVYESGSGRFPNVYDSFRSGTNSTSMIENLQSQLKQRDGKSSLKAEAHTV